MPSPPFELLSFLNGGWNPFTWNELDHLLSLNLVSHKLKICNMFSFYVIITSISANLLISLEHSPWTFRNPIFIPFIQSFKVSVKASPQLYCVSFNSNGSSGATLLKLFLSTEDANETFVCPDNDSILLTDTFESINVQGDELHLEHKVSKTVNL